jgi:hypothetical protein
MTPPGSIGLGLNILLPATSNYLGQNSLRMERDFLLASIQAQTDGNFSVILGTQNIDFFNNFIPFRIIFGNAVLPHKIPGEVIISKGDFLVVKTRNETSGALKISLLFQGQYL